MKKDRFFGFLGRANAVILFLVGLGALVLMGYGLWEVWQEERGYRPHSSEWKYRSSKLEAPAEDPVLPQGWFKNYGETSWVFADYEVERQEGGKSKGGAVYPELVNFLFLDTETGRTRWLRPTNAGSVELLENEILYSFDGGDLHAPLHLYLAREKDSTGDGVIDRNDQEFLAISAKDGSDYRVLLEEFGHVRCMKRNSAGHLTILHRLDEELWLLEIDPVTRELVGNEKVEVPLVGVVKGN